MKNLMKLFLVIIVFALNTETFAQRFGIMGGLNLSNMAFKSDASSTSYDTKPGFHIGASFEIPIFKIISIEPALLFSSKGCKTTMFGVDVKTNLYYLEVPINVKATFDVKVLKIYGALGPYIGIGLFGNAKAKDEKESIEWGSDGDLKRIDVGLTFGAGVEIGAIPIYFGLSYSLGLSNISASSDGGASINNRVFGISVGYKFGGKK